MSLKKREAIRAGFQEELKEDGVTYKQDFRPTFVCGSTGNIGFGLTLHRAPYMVLMEPSFLKKDEIQARFRISRVGQKSPATRSIRLIHSKVTAEMIILMRQLARMRFMELALAGSADENTVIVLE